MVLKWNKKHDKACKSYDELPSRMINCAQAKSMCYVAPILCMCLFAHMYVNIEARGQYRVFASIALHFTFFFLRQGIFLNLELTNCLA